MSELCRSFKVIASGVVITVVTTSCIASKIYTHMSVTSRTSQLCSAARCFSLIFGVKKLEWLGCYMVYTRFDTFCRFDRADGQMQSWSLL